MTTIVVIGRERVKEFPEEKLVTLSKQLFCMACREELVLKSIMELHIMSETHAKGKENGLARTSKNRT